jgi:hypothetical protein
VTFGINAPAPQVRIVDIFSSTDTRQPHRYGFEPGSARLNGNPIPDPSCDLSVVSQITCNFDFTNLGAGNHTLTYVWRFGAIRCYASGHDEVHIQLPPDRTNWGTHAVSYLVRC